MTVQRVELLGGAIEYDDTGGSGRPVVLWSRTDRMLPFAHAVAIAEALPHARLVAFDDGGSLLQLDEPARVAAEINTLALV